MKSPKFNIYLILLCTFFCSLLNKPLVAQLDFNLNGNHVFGQYEIGTKETTIHVLNNDLFESLSIRIWYPSDSGTEKIKFSEYFNYKGLLSQFEMYKALSIGISGDEDQFSSDTLSMILNSRMMACKEVDIRNGKFPLLIWSMRNGTIEYQNQISEYLASYGFVIAYAETIPNQAFPWAIESAEEKPEALNNQINILNIAIDYLQQQEYIDEEKIGILSWSYAGESAVLTQMSNPNIKLT